MGDPDLEDALGAVYRRDRVAAAALPDAAFGRTDAQGRTLLVHAVLADEPDLDLVGELIARGCPLDAADERGWTAMHYAARDQHRALVTALLGAGAAVDPADAHGDTPLWRLVMDPRADPSLAGLLLDQGADPRRRNAYGRSPLDIATDLADAPMIGVLTR